MAGFNGTVLTTKGRNLQAKAQIGTAVNFTKVKLGSGTLANGQSLESLNDLITPVMTLTIQGMTTNSDGTSKITVLVTNNGLETGFYVREIGLYATDPQLGEILYSVSNAGTLADYLPAGGGAVVVEQLFELITVVGNATNVTALIDTSLVLATKDDIITHNTSAIAHADLLHIWQQTKAYVKGDICFPAGSSYPSWMILECTTGGTSAATEPTWGSTVGAEITDNTAKWRVKNLISGSGVSIGTVMPHLATTAPAGWLACDSGALVSRTTYAELWSWVQAKAPLVTEAAWQAQAAVQTSVGAYSSGDGSTTFRLPRIVDYVRGGLTADVGTWQGDAIRNITGTFSLRGFTGSSADFSDYFGGVFSNGGKGTSENAVSAGTNIANQLVKLDASTQVPTADENRPKTIKMLYCVKAFDAVTNQGLIDITALANEVAGKQKTIQTAIINETQVSGTAGGTFTSGAWRTRTLNTLAVDQIGVTLSSNRFTLPAGTYELNASAPARGVSTHKARLQNITDATTVDIGTNEYTALTNSYSTTRSSINTVFTIASSQVFEIQHYSTSTASTDGFGNATSIASVAEIYTTVNIRKVG